VKSGIRNLPELLLGLGIIVIGVVIAFQAAGMKAGPAYAKVGPAVIPWLVAALMTACGALISWGARTSTNEDAETSELSGPAAIVAGLFLQVVLFERAGFVATASLLFFTTAYGFGSRRYLRDITAAIMLACIAYVVFRFGLGLKLPAGRWLS
jgi:putative tricarboxylic transport membrane protein